MFLASAPSHNSTYLTVSFDKADQPLSVYHPAYSMIRKVMHNMGQKLEQVFVIGGCCRQSLMADRVITSTW